MLIFHCHHYLAIYVLTSTCKFSFFLYMYIAYQFFTASTIYHCYQEMYLLTSIVHSDAKPKKNVNKKHLKTCRKTYFLCFFINIYNLKKENYILILWSETDKWR